MSKRFTLFDAAQGLHAFMAGEFNEKLKYSGSSGEAAQRWS